MGKKKNKGNSIWRIWAKALGEKGSKCDRESDIIAMVRSFIFLTYLITNVAIVSGVIRQWPKVDYDTKTFSSNHK